MTTFTWLWLIWLAFFMVVEGWALFSREPGSTLSEHVWRWFRIYDKPRQWTWRRIVLAGFLAWLLIHMVAGF